MQLLDLARMSQAWRAETLLAPVHHRCVLRGVKQCSSRCVNGEADLIGHVLASCRFLLFVLGHILRLD